MTLGFYVRSAEIESLTRGLGRGRFFFLKFEWWERPPAGTMPA